MATNIPQYTGSIPNRANDTPQEFADNVYNYQLYINDAIPAMNDGIEEVDQKWNDVKNQAVDGGYSQAYIDANFALKNGDSMEVFKVADASNPDEAVNKRQLLDAIPKGIILAFATASIPNGFLECNGAAISRVAYADLFSILGTMYGSGDGSTTFNLPDLRGEFIRGFDNGRGVDNGRALGSWQGDLFRSHNHISYNQLVYDTANPTINIGTSDVNFRYGVAGGTSYTGGSETRPRNIALMYCIKY